MRHLPILFVLLAFGCRGLSPERTAAGLFAENPERRAAAAESAFELGAELFPALAPKLASEDSATRERATFVIERIAHRSRDGDATALALIDMSQRASLPGEVRARLLRASGPAGRGSAVASRLAGLAHDSSTQRDALFALEAIGDHAAKAELARLLDVDKLRAHAATALARLDAREHAVALLAHSDDPACRAAVARLGDPRAARQLREAHARAEPGARSAWMRWLARTDRNELSKADRIKAWLELYSSDHPGTRSAAMQQLTTLDPAGNIERALTALSSKDAATRAIGRKALVASPDPKLAERLEATLPSVSGEVSGQILRVLVRRDAPNALRLVETAARAEDEAARIAALGLLAKFGTSSASARASVVLREAFARAKSDKELLAACEAAIDFARGEADRLDLLHTALERSKNTKQMQRALLAIAQTPNPKSLPVVEAVEKRSGLREQIARVRVAVADKLDREAAIALLSRAIVDARTTGTRRQAFAGLKKRGADAGRYIAVQGFIARWHILGPAPKAENAKALGDHPFGADGPKLDQSVELLGKAARWQVKESKDVEGLIDLTYLRPRDNVSAYGYAEVRWPRKQELRLLVGSDDGCAVWVNGKRVHVANKSRGVRVDEDTVKATFVKGVNRILIKVTNGGGGFGFCVRVANPRKRPIDLTGRTSKR